VWIKVVLRVQSHPPIQDCIVRAPSLPCSDVSLTQEEISFDDIVREVRIDEEMSRSMPLSDANRAALVIVQKPLVALRYRLPNGQVRWKPTRMT